MEVETNGVTSIYNDGIEYYSTQCVSKLKSNKAETHSENEKIAYFDFFSRKNSSLCTFSSGFEHLYPILYNLKHFLSILRHF